VGFRVKISSARLLHSLRERKERSLTGFTEWRIDYEAGNLIAEDNEIGTFCDRRGG
jgi:hypothetical protein